jgi:hypothetical protein
MYNFCTLFDRNYLSRGLALLESIETHSSDFQLFILCLDDYTHAFFVKNQNKHVHLIRFQDIEKQDKGLRDSKTNRSRVEYYFTLSPCLPLYLLQKYNLSHICSLDADIMFFGSPDTLFDLLDNYSIIITPHKFSKTLLLDDRLEYGKYNVSFQIFKNNKVGIECLEKWRTNCLNWCKDYYDEENSRYADQKYLDTWNNDFPGEVISLDIDTAGLAVWNIDNYILTLNNGTILSNNKPLIFYHFHHFKLINKNIALNGFSQYKVKKYNGVTIRYIYKLYWDKLDYYNKRLEQISDISARVNLASNKLKLLILDGAVFIKIFDINFCISYSLIPRTYINLRNLWRI